MLFEELFYNDAYKSFRVLCVDRPVEGPQSQIAAAGADEVPPSPKKAPFTPNKTTHAHARTHTHARAHTHTRARTPSDRYNTRMVKLQPLRPLAAQAQSSRCVDVRSSLSCAHATLGANTSNRTT